MFDIVLVDDDKAFLEMFEGMTEWERYDMRVVKSFSYAPDALEYIKDNPVDALISDISMPDMTGFQLADRLREIHPEIRLLFLSAYQDFEYAVQALKRDAVGYITKPVSYHQLNENLLRLSQKLKNKKRPYEIAGNRERKDIKDIKDGKENGPDEQEPFPQPEEPVSMEEVRRPAKLPQRPGENLPEVVQNYVDCYYMEDISLEVIAKYCYMNPEYFSRQFKKMTGEKFLDYLNRIRIEKAKERLAKKDIPVNVKTLYREVGYRSRSHFYKLFAQFTGMSPRDYRNACFKEQRSGGSDHYQE